MITIWYAYCKWQSLRRSRSALFPKEASSTNQSAYDRPKWNLVDPVHNCKRTASSNQMVKQLKSHLSPLLKANPEPNVLRDRRMWWIQCRMMFGNKMIHAMTIGNSHSQKTKSKKTIVIVALGCFLQPLDPVASWCTVLQHSHFIMEFVATLNECFSQEWRFHYFGQTVRQLSTRMNPTKRCSFCEMIFNSSCS